MRSYALTDVGIKRTMNQDFVYASDQPVGNLPNLLIVADGMGGHKAGDFASRCAVETMVDYIGTNTDVRPPALLGGAVLAASRAIAAKAADDRQLEGMGTTVVAASVVDECLYIANVGDSRLYLINEEMEQITVDHSLVEEMRQAGEITREEARSHPEKNVITRAVGIKSEVRADLFDVALREGDVVLLCSDGLTNMVTDEEICKLVKEALSLEEAGRALVRAANEGGGSDNISVILAVPDVMGDKVC